MKDTLHEIIFYHDKNGYEPVKSHARKVERTAKSGRNVDNVIAILSKAIGILKAATVNNERRKK